MKDLLQKFENKEPEIVFNWKDPETEAEGWTVINTDRPGWWRFEFASAQQQVLYNQCAPEGEYYARP